MRRTDTGVAVVRLHYTADAAMTPERVEAERKKYSSQAWWDLEMEIKYDALDGALVYPEFDITTHVVPDSMVPRMGCRYMSIDPHPRTPHAMLWVLIDAWGDWYVYREYWPSIVAGQPRQARDDEKDNSEHITKDYAEAIAYLEGNELTFYNSGQRDQEYAVYTKLPKGERIAERFMDQAGKGFRTSGEGQPVESYATRYADFGIECRDPYKAIEAGEEAIHDLLKPRQHEVRGVWPRLHVAASCKELILEFRKHRYKSQKSWLLETKELKQDGVEARTHMLDNLRYLATSDIGYVGTLRS